MTRILNGETDWEARELLIYKVQLRSCHRTRLLTAPPLAFRQVVALLPPPPHRSHLRQAYVGVFGRRIFVDALSSAIWSLEFADLAERAAQKRRGFGSKTKHDFELLLFERVLKQDGGPPQDAIDAIARGCTVLSNCGIEKTSNQTYLHAWSVSGWMDTLSAP